jgi:transposase-like protein
VKPSLILAAGILNEIKNRGVRDILPAAVDGLTGFPDAITTVFPKTEVQLCVVHMVRNSIQFVPYKDRKAITADLKKIYLAPSAELAATPWDARYPMIAKSWRTRRNEIGHIFPTSVRFLSRLPYIFYSKRSRSAGKKPVS